MSVLIAENCTDVQEDITLKSELHNLLGKYKKATLKSCRFLKECIIIAQLPLSSKPRRKFHSLWPFRHLPLASWNCLTDYLYFLLQVTIIRPSVLFHVRKICLVWKINHLVMLCAIWYHFHNLKNVKNTHGGVSK